MDTKGLFLIVAIAINVFLGSIIFFKNRHNKENKWFIFFVLSLIAWTVSMLFYRTADTYKQTIFWVIMLYESAIFVPFTMLYFSLGFPDGNVKLSKITKIALWLPVLVLVVLTAFVGNVVSSVKIIPGQEKIIQWGSYYLAYNFYFIFYCATILLVLWRKFKISEKAVRSQLKFIALGFFIPIIIANTTNLILPTLGIFYLNWMGQLTTIFMTGFIMYAIVKHRLMNVKVITTEFFTLMISFLLLLDAILSDTLTEFILKFGLFLGVVFFSYLLIRSVLSEIKAKEKLAQLSKDLKKANEELKKLDKAKSEFLSIASHQLRTPLTVIKGYSSMILEGDYGEVPGKMKEIVDRIFQSSNRLTMMVEDFLNISRIEMGRMKYDIVDFNLKETAENIVKDFQTNNKKAGVLDLQFSSENGEFYIKGDQNKLRQVISNIIDNALKYTESGYVKVNLSHSDLGKVLIKIQDSGAGIPEDSLKEIFGKFNRAQQISKEHVDGSGLGLYVAERIVKDHHGKIWAESEGRGKGSTFFIELPIG